MCVHKKRCVLRLFLWLLFIYIWKCNVPIQTSICYAHVCTCVDPRSERNDSIFSATTHYSIFMNFLLSRFPYTHLLTFPLRRFLWSHIHVCAWMWMWMSRCVKCAYAFHFIPQHDEHTQLPTFQLGNAFELWFVCQHRLVVQWALTISNVEHFIHFSTMMTKRRQQLFSACQVVNARLATELAICAEIGLWYLFQIASARRVYTVVHSTHLQTEIRMNHIVLRYMATLQTWNEIGESPRKVKNRTKCKKKKTEAAAAITTAIVLAREKQRSESIVPTKLPFSVFAY